METQIQKNTGMHTKRNGTSTTGLSEMSGITRQGTHNAKRNTGERKRKKERGDTEAGGGETGSRDMKANTPGQTRRPRKHQDTDYEDQIAKSKTPDTLQWKGDNDRNTMLTRRYQTRSATKNTRTRTGQGNTAEQQ